MTKKNKIMSLILAVMMLLVYIPTAVFATEASKNTVANDINTPTITDNDTVDNERNNTTEIIIPQTRSTYLIDIKEAELEGLSYTLEEGQTGSRIYSSDVGLYGSVEWTVTPANCLTIDDDGYITPLQAGSVEIVGGGYYCYLTVTLPDGVHYFNDVANDYRLEYENLSNLSENAPLESYYTNGEDEPTGRYQMFKTKYLGGGFYSIRSMLDSKMGWTRSSSSLVMTTIGTSDTSLSATERWEITSDANGYYIRCHSERVTVTAGSSSGNNITLTTYSENNLMQHWDIGDVTEEYNGLTFKNSINTIVIDNSSTFSAIVYSSIPGENGQNGIEWSVSNGTGCASIDQTTGFFTAFTAGTVTVTASYFYAYDEAWTLTCSVYIRPIENGTYFFVNGEYNKLMQIDDGVSQTSDGAKFELWDVDSADDQRWNIEYLSGEYYKITSVASGMAVTAPSADNSNITQTEYTNSDNQKWKIISLSNGMFRLSPKSNTSRYMAAGDGELISDGRNVEMRASQSDNKDEWVLCQKGNEVVLLGVISTEELGHDHMSCYNDTLRYFGAMYDHTYDYDVINTNYISVSTCKAKMVASKIFISRSHGSGNSNYSYIHLFDSGTESILYSYDIYDFATNTRLVNLYGTELMLYIGCKTAYGGNTGTNLITASVNAGADYALGFKDTINCSGANTWTSYFCEYYDGNETIYEVAQNAADYAAYINPVLDALGELNVDTFSIASSS